MVTMIYERMPKWFTPQMEVVSCYLENNEEIVMLQKNIDGPYPGRWGPPAGKLKEDEMAIDGLIREVWEESGIELNPTEVTYIDHVFVRYPKKLQFVYHQFHAIFDQRPKITVNPNEHKAMTWIKPRRALDLSLMYDERKLLTRFYRL